MPQVAYPLNLIPPDVQEAVRLWMERIHPDSSVKLDTLTVGYDLESLRHPHDDATGFVGDSESASAALTSPH